MKNDLIGATGEAMPSSRRSNIESLPFVKVRSKEEEDAGVRRLFWSVIPTGDYSQDGLTGSAMAKEAIGYMRRENFPSLLGWIALDIAKADSEEHCGLVVGFFNEVACQLIRGAA